VLRITLNHASYEKFVTGFIVHEIEVASVGLVAEIFLERVGCFGDFLEVPKGHVGVENEQKKLEENAYQKIRVHNSKEDAERDVDGQDTME
jgi:hypothetical protein